MFTMTAREIKETLRRNKRAGRRPRSQNEIARMKGVARSLISMAIKKPRRYPDARLYIESVLRNGAAQKAS